jgi:mannose-1-phosphate guanylyltransferase
MNIVLLSGGSGKRLWPLSNETRSKQFLKLLNDSSGKLESMVQRVYRQLNEAGYTDEDILIATGATQVDAIHNQLGEKVKIIVEPERRNTFPAIALSSAYLFWEKKCGRNEVVIVLPVDPYADGRYFEILKTMESTIQANIADLVLMGIRPTYPSEKYGYIVPSNNLTDEVATVQRFTEKPSLEYAKELLASGAVWNGGVFAFKLGWMMDKLRDTLNVDSYGETLNRYGELKNTSFDYEVVENTSSIAMVTYDGIWKDLGTWNTLTEEMYTNSLGKVIIGEDTHNTHIINELNIPILALGLNNLVIAASPDGILISDKSASSYLKPYVEDIAERPMYEEKRWGKYWVVSYNTFNDTKSLTKHLFIMKGKSLSYQRHNLRDEIWTIVDGTGDLLIDGHIRNVRRGDVAYITKGQLHAIRAISDLHFIEVQIGSQLEETDIERFEWEWH